MAKQGGGTVTPTHVRKHRSHSSRSEARRADEQRKAARKEKRNGGRK